VQDAEEADLGAKMFWIQRNLQKGLGYSTEQQVVEFDLVLEDERVQLMRKREHDMEISCRQKFPLAGGDPTLSRLALAFWTVAIATCNGEISITCLMGSTSLWGVEG
jgi:hypothetical protein